MLFFPAEEVFGGARQAVAANLGVVAAGIGNVLESFGAVGGSHDPGVRNEGSAAKISGCNNGRG
jgi:hypothetical protein